ncbi:sensor histidine kinase [Pedobacter sp. SD-b]|uniref:histidine kinase n=1 Tax=Pedobacter segetis TaxID=2793069 RepID=A0ABS1BKY8_9SPHI|nr:sensor histidine kinase [Pedobacter segetis]MBK0383468.1 sensor histidine kinase [Pedobacter segetis]
MKKLLLFLTGFLITVCGTAQSPSKKDSLARVLYAAKEDTGKVILFLRVGEQFENSDPEKAKQYYRQALALSKKIGYKAGELKYASYYSSVLNIQGLFYSSLAVNLRALQMAKKMKDSLAIVKASFNVANSYTFLGKNDSTLYYYFQVLPYLEKQKDNRMLSIAYNNLQDIYRRLHQYHKGITYGKIGVAMSRANKDSLKLEYGLTNLGTNYASLHLMDTALACYKEAFEISKKIGDQYGESAAWLNIADIDYQQGRYEVAKNGYSQALKIARELALNETATIALKGLAMYFLQMKNYAAALQYADSSLALAAQNENREQRVKIYKILSDIAYGNQDLISAKEFDSKEDQLNDSINNDNLSEITTRYEKEYETSKKESQIKLQQVQLKQKSVLNYCLIAGATALLIISLLTYRNHRHTQKLQQFKIDELETERQLTATEAVLKGEEQERTRLAKDLHDGLGGMLSGIKFSLSNMKENLIMTPDNAQAFERSIDMLDSSIQEMRRVAHNMMPEMLLRYGLKVALEELCNEVNRSSAIYADYQFIGTHTTINQTIAVTVYRIVQELVNNAIKHAHAQNVLVQLHALEQEKLLTITIEDDGKGFDKNLLTVSKARPHGQAGRGMGWNNIQNRVDFLKGKIDVHSEIGKGTSVLIEINI